MLAAIWQGPFIRLVPVGMVFLALQRSLFVEITIAGVIIQVVLALAAAAGAAAGSERGAIAGFTLGVMYDMLEGLPIGSTAVAMTLAGAVAGLLALIVADPQWWLAMMFTTLGAAAGEVMLPVVRLFTGVPDPFEPRLTIIVPVVSTCCCSDSASTVCKNQRRAPTSEKSRVPTTARTPQRRTGRSVPSHRHG